MIVRYLLDSAYIRDMVVDSNRRGKVLPWLLHLRIALQQNAQLHVDKEGIFLKALGETISTLKAEEKRRSEATDSSSVYQVSPPPAVQDTLVLVHLRELLVELVSNCRKSIPIPKNVQNFRGFSSYCIGIHRPDAIITNDPELTKNSGTSGHPQTLAIEEFPESTLEKTRRGWLGKQTFASNNASDFEKYVDSFARGSQSIEIMDRLIWKSGRQDYYKSMGYLFRLIVQAGVERITVVSVAPENGYPLDLPKILESLNDELRTTKLHSDGRLDLVVDTKKEDGGDAFHDRFAISDTHYFAVGRGFDVRKVIGNRDVRWRLFNTYFCGRRTGSPGAEAVDSRDITTIRNLPSQEPSSESPSLLVEMSDSTGKKITVAVSFAADIDRDDNF